MPNQVSQQELNLRDSEIRKSLKTISDAVSAKNTPFPKAFTEEIKKACADYLVQQEKDKNDPFLKTKGTLDFAKLLQDRIVNGHGLTPADSEQMKKARQQLTPLIEASTSIMAQGASLANSYGFRITKGQLEAPSASGPVGAIEASVLKIQELTKGNKDAQKLTTAYLDKLHEGLAKNQPQSVIDATTSFMKDIQAMEGVGKNRDVVREIRTIKSSVREYATENNIELRLSDAAPEPAASTRNLAAAGTAGPAAFSPT